MSAAEDKIELEGSVTSLNRDRFTVTCENGHEANCTTGGRLRKNMIRITVGDRVKVQLSAYDLSRGIITYRM